MRTLLLVTVVLLTLALVGCGGGGGTKTTDTETGAATGQLNAANASGFRLVLDGEELSATTGADGSFTLPNLPPGNHNLAIIGDGGMVGAHVGFVVEPGKTTDIGDVTAVAGGQVVGIVSKRDGGGNLTPLEGVEVIADAEPIYWDGSDPSTAAGSRRAKQSDTLELKAITDSNGSYLMPAVPEGAYVVTVNVPGYVQGVSWVYVSSASTAACDFQLLAAIEEGVGTVSGTITALKADGTSAPLEGAVVTVTSDTAWVPVPPTDTIPLPPEAFSKALIAKPDQCVMPPLYEFKEFTTLTDASGHYSLNVPSGYLNLSAWAEGYIGAWDSFSVKPDQTVEKSYQIQEWTDDTPIPDNPPTTERLGKHK